MQITSSRFLTKIFPIKTKCRLKPSSDGIFASAPTGFEAVGESDCPLKVYKPSSRRKRMSSSPFQHTAA
ncbi:hypothetical protein NEILACOT_05597 [Neisseria lactamica ATCC 23970]|uniref:Uncharacterized protein n=1 Tax=Neisseria lactamica ATCC 23970 TaxID=546265 RepID=D0WDG1_NEILA|nr:hypothetical protein NEILACOT_05597 [Neisseria lactamica ATCC 23970]